MRWLFLPLILLCFFGSLIVAAWCFPLPYDWRTRVISNLLSPRDNPHYYRVPSIGIAVAGLLMLPMAFYFEQRLGPIARRLARTGRWCLTVAIALLICAAIVVPQHVKPIFGITRLHEALARTSAMFFGVAMLCFCGCAWRDRRSGTVRLDRRLLPLWCCLTVLPISGILLSEALLFIARGSATWGPRVKETMRHSVFWHLGFWEWAGSAAVFLFLTLAIWLLPEHGESEEPRARD
jgi:hypothetical protein